jgi:uncharacterized protein (TIGR02611 family)
MDRSGDAVERQDGNGFLQAISNKRNDIRHRRTLNLVYRCAVGFIGTAVLAVGIVTIPYPGPGWLIVFTGLGILSTEFVWAHHVLKFAKGKYDNWMDWISAQHWSVQAVFWLLTCAVVLGTLWVLGAMAMGAGWVGIDWTWLESPVL